MKKSVRIHLLVITTVVAIFTFVGIWYLRPGVPNELLEQARARQLQPLLEIDAPMRRPVAEPVPRTEVDRKALVAELLPTLTEQVSRSLEGPLYEKLKTQFALDEGFVSQISAKLQEKISMGTEPEAPAIPQGLQAEFSQQIEALRTELLSLVGEEQASFFTQIEGMLDSRLDRIEDDLNIEMQAYVPQLVDRMIPSLVEMLVNEFDNDMETYLPYLAQELKPYLVDSFTEEELLLLYASYRDQVVADLVPEILAAMEVPARKDVAQMVKSVVTAAVPPVPKAPITTVVSSVSPAPTPAPAVVAVPVPTPAPVAVPAVAPAPIVVESVPSAPVAVAVPASVEVKSVPAVPVPAAVPEALASPEMVITPTLPEAVAVPTPPAPSAVVIAPPVPIVVAVPTPPVLAGMTITAIVPEGEPVPAPPALAEKTITPILAEEVALPAPSEPRVTVKSAPVLPVVAPVPATPTPSVVKSVPALPEAVAVPSPPALAEMKTTPILPEAIPATPTVKPVKSTVDKPKPIILPPSFAPGEVEVFVDPLTYEQKRTEIRNKAIQEVLDRINAQ